MDERDQFSISMWLGLWYKLGQVVYYFFLGETGSFTQDRKKCLREKAAKVLDPIYIWYIHTYNYISACVDVNACVCMCIYTKYI